MIHKWEYSMKAWKWICKIWVESNFELEKYMKVANERKQRGFLAKACISLCPYVWRLACIEECWGRPGYVNTVRHVVENEFHLLLHCSKYHNITEGFHQTVRFNSFQRHKFIRNWTDKNYSCKWYQSHACFSQIRPQCFNEKKFLILLRDVSIHATLHVKGYIID